jgi:hypothetical protein
MPVTQASDHDTSAVAADELEELVASWRRHLRAQRMSPATISTYTVAVRQLAAYLRTQGMPVAPAAIHRERVVRPPTRPHAERRR